MKINNKNFLECIQKDKDKIENIELETSDGTKKFKEKFHKNAVSERNSYIDEKINLYEEYKTEVKDELLNRMNSIIPNSNNEFFNISKIKLNNYLEAIICSNDDVNVGLKLRLDFLIASINESTSLNVLNDILKSYIYIFNDLDIKITSEDFNYSMFTKNYMDYFFENENGILQKFEKIFFECPNFITHMKMNLKHIINKYDSLLNKNLKVKTDRKIQSFDASNSNLLDDYLNFKDCYKWNLLKDDNNVLQSFLSTKNIDDYFENSDVRKKNFTRLCSNYFELDEEGRNNIHNVFYDFHNTLDTLLEFYRYKFILDDLVIRYNNKANSKSNFDVKSKEISSLEKNRVKINDDYYKSLKKGLFKKPNVEKSKLFKVQINEEIIKIDKAYDEYYDALFNKNIAEKLNDASTLNDFFEITLNSFYYIKHILKKQFASEEGFDLEKEYNRFVNFLYNPYNKFLRKINALASYDVCKVITDKFVISGLNITTEDLNTDNINETDKIIDFDVLCLLLDNSSFDSKKIKFICEVKKIN